MAGGGGLLIVGDCGRLLLHSLRSVALHGCVVLHAVIGRGRLTLVWIRVAVLVGRGRSGFLRLRDDWGDDESCCQCGRCNRFFGETISGKTRGRHVFACLPAFVCPAHLSCNRTSRRAKLSSSRAGSPWSSAHLIRHEFIPFVAGMPSTFFPAPSELPPGWRRGFWGT